VSLIRIIRPGEGRIALPSSLEMAARAARSVTSLLTAWVGVATSTIARSAQSPASNQAEKKEDTTNTIEGGS